MVILPMVFQYQRMLQRNLLYTAVTRSKDKLILLGESQAFQTCVSNQSANRLTTLAQRIAVLTASKSDGLITTEIEKSIETTESQKQHQPLTYESEFSLTHEAVKENSAVNLVEENNLAQVDSKEDMPLRFVLTR